MQGVSCVTAGVTMLSGKMTDRWFYVLAGTFLALGLIGLALNNVVFILSIIALTL